MINEICHQLFTEYDLESKPADSVLNLARSAAFATKKFGTQVCIVLLREDENGPKLIFFEDQCVICRILMKGIDFDESEVTVRERPKNGSRSDGGYSSGSDS